MPAPAMQIPREVCCDVTQYPESNYLLSLSCVPTCLICCNIRPSKWLTFLEKYLRSCSSTNGFLVVIFYCFSSYSHTSPSMPLHPRISPISFTPTLHPRLPAQLTLDSLQPPIIFPFLLSFPSFIHPFTILHISFYSHASITFRAFDPFCALTSCSDLEEKRTASQPSLGEDSKLCSEDNLDFNGSSAITTELNMDESLASQISRPSEGGLPDSSLLNPTTISPATNGMSNCVTVLD